MRKIHGGLDGSGARIALVVSRFNDLIGERLLEGAVDCLTRHGVSEEDITVVRVPGAWELPAACSRILAFGEVDGVVALGCVIRGATPHFDYVAGEAAAGLGALNRSGQVPVGFGLLTTDTLEQAIERAGAKAGNKGWDAAQATLEMVDLFRKLE
jgi:6,7-dimethyl-8-ribityllumazine synthase